MLRAAVPSDTPAILALSVDTEMFQPHEVGFVQEMLDDFHAQRLGPGHRVEVWVDDPAGPPLGVAYFAPDINTDRKWDLWMIAVTPARQRQGIGGHLLRSAVTHAREAGARMIVIETSSLPRFDATHAFYRRHGHSEVARIPDFYRDGESKVIFARRLIDRA